jgi:hypothetical protein
MRQPPLKHLGRNAAALLLPLLLVSVSAQSPPYFPTQNKQLPVTAYSNHVLGFKLSYPTIYQEQSRFPGSVADIAERRRSQILLYATRGRGKKKCEDEGQCDKFGTLTITIDSRPFALKTIGEHYEHTGWVEALPFRVGSNTFYYIGAGGGGVNYPDTFFYNLHGRILVIEFNGPYPTDSKSPSDETKAIEKLVLGANLSGRTSDKSLYHSWTPMLAKEKRTLAITPVCINRAVNRIFY